MKTTHDFRLVPEGTFRELTRGATVYELTNEERACMKRLTDAGLVVSIGKHSRLREQNAELAKALEEAADCIDLLGKNCVDRIWDGNRGIPVTAKGARAALAKAKG